MQFVKSPNTITGRNYLAKLIDSELKDGRKILWLIPGGSNIVVVKEVMELLGNELNNLTIMLTDERFGTVGHKDSNSQQLYESGFNPKEAVFIPVLINKALDETIDIYSENYQKTAEDADLVIGHFGIGTDGHTAGILPHSPAVTSSRLVVGYEAEPYVRITLTPKALGCVGRSVCFAFGDSKEEALTRLRDSDISIEDQPCQLFKKFSNINIYNDQIGGI